MHVFFRTIYLCVTELAALRTPQTFDQSAHVRADQLMRRLSNESRHRAIHTQHPVTIVVNHNKVGDSVEDVVPVPARLRNLVEKTRILQRYGCMCRQGLQQTRVVASECDAAVREE